MLDKYPGKSEVYDEYMDDAQFAIIYAEALSDRGYYDAREEYWRQLEEDFRNRGFTERDFDDMITRARFTLGQGAGEDNV